MKVCSVKFIRGTIVSTLKTGLVNDVKAEIKSSLQNNIRTELKEIADQKQRAHIVRGLWVIVMSSPSKLKHRISL
jgi:hypothetical protein